MEEKNTVEIGAEFPFLRDEDILNLRLNVLYRILGSVKATDIEVELIKRKRRKLQKIQFKQKNDYIMQNTIESLELLKAERNALLEICCQLEKEIIMFKTALLEEC